MQGRLPVIEYGVQLPVTSVKASTSALKPGLSRLHATPRPTWGVGARRVCFGGGGCRLQGGRGVQALRGARCARLSGSWRVPRECGNCGIQGLRWVVHATSEAQPSCGPNQQISGRGAEGRRAASRNRAAPRMPLTLSKNLISTLPLRLSCGSSYLRRREGRAQVWKIARRRRPRLLGGRTRRAGRRPGWRPWTAAVPPRAPRTPGGWLRGGTPQAGPTTPGAPSIRHAGQSPTLSGAPAGPGPACLGSC
jgi:hypothetical protein